MDVNKDVKNWLEMIKQSKSSNTYALYKMVIHQIIGEFGSPTHWGDSTINSFLEWCAGRENSLSTRNTKLQVIRSFIKSMGLDILVPEQVSHPSPNPKVASVDNVKALVGKLKGKYRLALLLMADAGLREAEVRHLRWDDVDDMLTIYGKGNKIRMIPIATERLSNALKQGQNNGNKYVVSNGNGSPICSGWLSKKIAKVSEELGIGRLTAHSFRHQFAARAVRRGVPVKAIQVALGHSNLVTTDHYLRSLVGNNEFLEKSFECFDV